MGRSALRVTWYRFATTFGRRWTGYLSLVLLIGLLGGIGMASVGAARRTQQYPAEIESYQSIGATPALLASGLAIGVAAAPTCDESNPAMRS